MIRCFNTLLARKAQIAGMNHRITLSLIVICNFLSYGLLIRELDAGFFSNLMNPLFHAINFMGEHKKFLVIVFDLTG